MIEKAGLKAWPKLLQNLRATRETELRGKYPAKDVISWLGNSPTNAHKHYAMTTDEAFTKATKELTAIWTPSRTPTTVQGKKSQDKTGKKQKTKKIAIDTAKGVIRLDLSSLDAVASNAAIAVPLGLEPRTTDSETAVLPITPWDSVPIRVIDWWGNSQYLR